MTDLVHARLVDSLNRLRLSQVAHRLDALLSDAARSEPSYLDFLDQLLREEVASKHQKRIAMGIQIAHFPVQKTLDDFDFKFQPSIDSKLVRELATGCFVANGENVLLFGPPGVGKPISRSASVERASRRGIRCCSRPLSRLLDSCPKPKARVI